MASGARIAGYKVGLTAKVMQEMIGVDEPDFGHLLEEMRIDEDLSADSTRYCAARIAPDDVDLVGVEASLLANGEKVASGRSDAVMGHPARAVAWFAEQVGSLGVELKAGDVVLPGSCTRAVDIHAGDDFVADFTGIGGVHIAFA